jgi:predicted dehydrogenase
MSLRTSDETTLVRRAEDKPEEQIAAEAVPAPYDNELSYIRAVILDGAKQGPLSSLDTNVTVIEILEAARRSAAEGRTIQLPSAR